MSCSNDGTPWTPELDDVLRRAYQTLDDLEVVARIMGRTPAAIRSRASELGLRRGGRVGERALLTADEVADLLGKSRRAVYGMKGRGQLPGATKLGRLLRFRKADIYAYLEKL